MRAHLIGAFALLFVTPIVMGGMDPVAQLQERYRTDGAGPFSADAGRALWHKKFSRSGTDAPRSCATCHTDDLSAWGEHVRTGKEIKPMAPSANPERLTETRKVRKWFLRNCKWTLGRECSAQEKGDVLEFLKTR